MAEVVSCPSCQRKLQVPDNLVGQDVQCPSCSATFLAQSGMAPVKTPSAAPVEDQPRLPERAGRKDWDDDQGARGADPRPGSVRRRRRGDLLPHRGTTILTLGILSLVLGLSCYVPFLLGAFAWIMGNNDLAAMRAGSMDPEGEGMTQGGRICGLISTILLILGLLFFCAMVGFFLLVTPGRQRRF